MCGKKENKTFFVHENIAIGNFWNIISKKMCNEKERTFFSQLRNWL